MNKILTILLLLLLAACDESKTSFVQQETLEVTVSASGELESKKTAMIAPPSISRMWQYQIKQLAPENMKIKKGQPLVSFDDKKVSERLIDKQAKLDQAKKELINKSLKEEATEQSLVLSVAEKKMNFEKAQRKADIVDNSRSENDRKKAEIDFTIAKNDLFLSQEKLKYHRDNKALNVKLLTGKVDRLTFEVNNLKNDISRLKVKAPIDGMVIYRSNHQGEKPAVGENTMFGQPIIELAVIEQMQLKAQIDEPESGKIKVGQKVIITLDATQEFVVHGKISSIGNVFRNKSYQDRRRIVDTIIELEETDSKLMRPGMTARVQIVIDTIEGALTLPAQAIQHSGDRTFVMQKGFLGSSLKPVEIHKIIGSKVLISKGLALGDVVSL